MAEHTTSVHPSSYWRNRVLRTVLLGTVDSRSALSILRGHLYIIKTIFDLVIESWILHINSGEKGYIRRDYVIFPPYRGIQVNMMPFIMGDRSSLPNKYRHYWPMITKCNVLPEERGKIGYLTIHESYVNEGTSQRRGGLHTETPGRFKKGGGFCGVYDSFHWGEGWRFDGNLYGGIYMASNVENSCEVWDKIIECPEHVVGKHGDMEHLRDYIGQGTLMENNRLYWMTDRTPHEFLPLCKKQKRQYFRLVTSNVSGWFEKHSTANPLVTLPNYKIIKENKFDCN